MLAVRRIFRNSKTLSNYISTSHVVNCEDSKKSNKAPNPQEEKRDVASEKVASSTEQGKINVTPKKAKKNSKRFEKQTQTQGPQEAPKIKTDFFKRLLLSSVDSVAKDLGGNKMETKKNLLDYIKTFETTKEPENESFTFEGLIKDEKPPRPSLSKKSSGVQIFHPQIMESSANQVKLNIWDTLEVEELEYKSLTSPRNYFEELIQWTNEGKLWRFPIDNDQGLEEEGKVSFTEHIFLEQHLEPWCPKKGPLRKFMELVLIGLSKNPYLTVEEKKEHIKWFENYFEGKKKLLQELGAVGTKEINA